MKAVFFLVLILITAFAQAEDRKITGTFEAVSARELYGVAGLTKDKDVAEKNKDLAEKLKQTLVITEKDIALVTGDRVWVNMTYTIQGDFLLGKTSTGLTYDKEKIRLSEMFYPIYIKGSDTLFFGGQKFVRKKEDAK